MDSVRVAAVQMDPQFGQRAANLDAIEESVRAASEAGARLVVLPECAVTGYMVESLDEGLDLAEPVPGPSVRRLEAIARRTGACLVAGLLERADDRLFNACVLVGPSGYLATYRKTHTLCLGVDRFANPGDIPYAVHELPFARIGILICYDLRFPEAARSLALAGAQIVCLPTNWPDSSGIMPEVFARARAAENRVYLVAADRVGRERRATFLGRSVVAAPDGRVLAEAGTEHPETLIVDLDLAEADRKHVVFRPGEHEMDIFDDRRPDLYQADRRPTDALAGR
jgi:predicted amidohydrolase